MLQTLVGRFERYSSGKDKPFRETVFAASQHGIKWHSDEQYETTAKTAICGHAGDQKATEAGRGR